MANKKYTLYLICATISLILSFFARPWILFTAIFGVLTIIGYFAAKNEQFKINQQIEYEKNNAQREAVLNQKRAEFSNELSLIPKVEVKRSSEKVKRQPLSEMPEIHFYNITRSTALDKMFPLVCVDIETTGLQLRGNDIIEVSAIKYDVGFKPISCFTTLTKPKKPIPPEASRVNNITDNMVADAPSFSEIAIAFSEYISDCNIVGHNVMFDLKFLFASGAKLPPKARYYDTLDLARKALSGVVYDYRLDTLCGYFNIIRNEAHRSSSDCLATAKLFEMIIKFKTI